MRKMGLAREALKGFQAREKTPIVVVAPDWDPRTADGRLSDEGLPLPESARYLERIVQSLPKISP